MLKLLFRDCLSRLYPRPLVECDLPSTGELTLREKENSLVVHLSLYSHRRCPLSGYHRGCDPPFQRTVSGADRAPAPPGEAGASKGGDFFRDEDGYVSFVVPEITGHQNGGACF